jgi:hypothetical protein
MTERIATHAAPRTLVEGQRLDQPTFHALWYKLEHRTLVQQPIDDDGLYHSTVFPGLWLDPAALLNGDTRRLRAVVDLGCATTNHAAFVARLAAAHDGAGNP